MNDSGELGLGTSDASAHVTPAKVASTGDWAAVSCGCGNCAALKKDGTLWVWGVDNPWVSTVERHTPTQIGSAHDWAAVSSGYWQFSALKKDGSLWAWGDNGYGELGLGKADTHEHPSPVRVGRENDWVAVSGGGDFTLALKNDGTLCAWGSNTYGQLGLGDAKPRHSPTEVGSAHDWAAVSAGIGYGLSLKKDGSLWAWGDDTFGQLGLGDTVSRPSPTQVGSDTDWVAVSCLAHHSLALKKDGSLWAWGENCYGQLGLGDTHNRLTPTQVGGDTNWASLAVGGSAYYHSLALKKDGSLWAWGWNRYGQLGLGDTASRVVPTMVGADSISATPSP